MKFLTISIGMLGLAAVIICLGCGRAARQPDPSATGADRPSVEAALMDHKDLKNHSENYSLRWYDSQSPDRAEGVALVIHGLNLRPCKMESIINVLTDSGIDALNLSLRGHGENYDRHLDNDPARARLATFKSVSYESWMDETCAAYSAARGRSVKMRVPLFFVGYSLGGLLGVDLLASRPDIQFDKMVLFAPAIKMHLRNNLIRLLSPFPRLTIPTFTLASYQSNNGTPMAAYNALFNSLKNFSGHTGPKINVPTLVFIDKNDEIVSFCRLKQMVKNENFDQWQFYIVKKESTKEPAKIHHVIIDEPSTGEDVWKDMMRAMVNHLHN